jgi:UDP-2-acetamido-3-amino-2,3-dideoxy-glucuronate N-acetyltransferase
VGNSLSIGRDCFIHESAVLGYVPRDEQDSIEVTTIGDRVDVGAFCVVEVGASIGTGVKLAHHSVIAVGARIGDGSLIVDSIRVDRRALVGKNCVVGGNVSDRAVLGDDVTFMGEMAHTYSDATEPWEGTDEISPIIRSGTVVAQGAQIIGGITVGEGCYIAAGEIVRTDVPPYSFVVGGRMVPISSMRGRVRARRGEESL